jgi:hypothetical protein
MQESNFLYLIGDFREDDILYNCPPNSLVRHEKGGVTLRLADAVNKKLFCRATNLDQSNVKLVESWDHEFADKR